MAASVHHKVCVLCESLVFLPVLCWLGVSSVVVMLSRLSRKPTFSLKINFSTTECFVRAVAVLQLYANSDFIYPILFGVLIDF